MVMVMDGNDEDGDDDDDEVENDADDLFGGLTGAADDLTAGGK